MKERNTTLDLAKGILIILVVLGHAIQYSGNGNWEDSQLFFDDIVFRAIYSFHMPLFMMISGYLFYSSNKKDFKPLMISKLRAIGIPLLVFTLLMNVVWYIPLLINGKVLEIFSQYLGTLVFKMNMWFLLSLLLNMVAVAVITRVFKRIRAQYIGMCILFMISFFIPDGLILAVHKFMFPFFCIGYVLNQNQIPLFTYSQRTICLVILTVLSLGAIWWFDKETSIYTTGFCILKDFKGQLQIDFKRMIIALIVSCTFMQYVSRLSRYNTFIAHQTIRLGGMTLFIYGMNMVFNLYTRFLVDRLSLHYEPSYLRAIFVTILFLFVCHYLYQILNQNRIARAALLGKFY